MNSSASDSTQGSSSNCDSSALQPTAFWELGTRSEIRNTRTFIQAFNNATESDERQMFCRWLRGYSEWISGQISLEDKDAEALVHLFDLECKTDEDRDICKSIFCSLCRKVTQDNLSSANLMKALDYALIKIDKSLLGDQTGLLLSLVDQLLESLARKSLTKDTYEIYGAALFALHQMVILLANASPNLISCSKYMEINVWLKKIDTSQEYYPIAYIAKLIKIGMDKLSSESISLTTVDLGHRAFYVTIGGLYFAQAISALVHLNLDVDAFRSAVLHLRMSISDMFGKRLSDHLTKPLELIFRATGITMSTNDFTHFKECYDAMMKRLGTSILKRSTWTMLRYCMVTELQLIALNASSARVQHSAIEELVSWGNRCSVTRWLTESQHVFQALLESLHSIHKRDKTDQLRRVITSMTANNQFRDIVKGWLGSNTLEDKLREEAVAVSQIEDVDRLYSKIRNKLGLSLTHEDVQTNLKDMKDTYCADSFAKVNTIFEDDCKKHVRDFEHHIVCYSDVVLEESTQDSFDGDHFAEDNRRKERKKESVALRDLFKPRALGFDSSAKSVEKVLLLGSPGTGKTSISKSLAYRWAAGEIARDFESVYVVPVRNLTKEAAGSFRRENILVNTIAESCFSRQRTEEDEYNKLIIQIKIDLLKPSTLLIIDGIDEGDSDGKAIIEQMLKFKCSLLFTSRPYYLVDIREQVDMEMECLGLNDLQVIDFVHGALPESWANRMIEFLTEHVSIWETSHVPVNLHIYCSLWKEKEERGEKGPIITENESLYSQMIHLIWRRFVEKSKSQLNESEVLETLERIAFEAQSKRKALIEPRIVQKHIKGPLPSKVFRDAGFLLLKMEGGFYQFPHLSFQENLAGKHLARLLLSTPKDKEEAERLISKMKYDEVHSTTLSFMAQEAFYMRRHALEIILKAVDEGQRDVLGLRHIILKLRLAEAYFSVHEREEPGIPSFNLCFDIVKAGTALFSACQGNDASTEILFRRFLQFPNVFRVISRSFPNEMAQIRDVVFKARNPEHSARFIQMSPNELETFLENDSSESELSDEHRINVLAFLPLEYYIKVKSANWDRILNFLGTRCVNKHNEISRKSMKLLGRCIGSYPDMLFDVDDVMKTFTFRAQFDSMDLCFQLLKENCASSDAAIRFLSRKCKHEKDSVRQRALKHISDIARLFPNDMTPYLEILKSACKDVSSNVQGQAILQFGEIARLFPAIAGEVWTTLSESVEETNPKVRLAVVQKAPELAAMFADGCEAWQLFSLCFKFDDIRKDAISRISEMANASTKFQQNAWELVTKLCHDEDDEVRQTAFGQLVMTAKLVPENKNNAWDLLSQGCHDSEENVRIITIDHLSDFAAFFSEYADKALDLVSKLCQDKSEIIQKTAIRQRQKMALEKNTNNSGNPSGSSQIMSGCSSNEVGSTSIFSRSETLIDLDNGTQEEKVDMRCTLPDACKNPNDQVRSQAIERIEYFATFPENLPDACTLLRNLCEDRNIDIRQKAFVHLIKLSKSGNQNGLPLSDIMELANKIGTDRAMFLAMEAAAELLGTEHENMALDVLFKASSNQVKTHKSKALECLEKIPLQELLFRIWKSGLQKGLHVLVERLLTTTYITFDPNPPEGKQFIIVEAKGASESEMPLSDGRILVNALRTIISAEYPKLLDALSSFCVQFETPF